MQDLGVLLTIIEAQRAAKSWKWKDGVKDLPSPKYFPWCSFLLG